MTTKPDFSATK